VVPIYVESTADATEARLMAALAKRCPQLPQAEGLRVALASLRRTKWFVSIFRTVTTPANGAGTLA